MLFSVSTDEINVLRDILTPAAFWLACFLNSFGYMQE